jgi:hypothetical protein
MDPWGRDAAVMKESTLNRADVLTLSPLLRYSLGAPDTVLPFRRVLDSGTSVILNLAVIRDGVRTWRGPRNRLAPRDGGWVRRGSRGQLRCSGGIAGGCSRFSWPSALVSCSSAVARALAAACSSSPFFC